MHFTIKIHKQAHTQHRHIDLILGMYKSTNAYFFVLNIEALNF